MVTNSQGTESGRKLTYLNRRHHPNHDNQFTCKCQNSQRQWTESGQPVHQ